MKTIKLEIPNERTLSMINHQGLANQSTSRSGHEPTNSQRRTFIGGALAALVSLPALAHAVTIRSPLKQGELPANPFVILLRGTYKPVKRCPDLGLFLVNICDGSYLTVKIYSVSGLLEEDEEDREQVIGNFYVAPGMGKPIAYDLPGGALTMVFTGNNLTSVPDGQGGTFLVGTFDLNITEATGVYQSFVHGHNRMVDILHRLADGTLVEHCYCVISRP
jgi:hypothetical protein